MDTSDFLQRVVGSAGFYCLLAIGKDKKRRQKFYPRAEQLIHASNDFDADGWDAYYAMGSFGAAGSREAANVSEMKALYLDLDCGEAKDYPDQISALKALRAFVKQTRLPKPIVVNSGRGIHVYWPLEAAVPTAAWHPVAVRLKAACVALGLRTDSTATADAARVLRLPGTHNHKDSPPNPVEVVSWGDEPTALAVLDDIISKHAPANAVKISPVLATSALFSGQLSTPARAGRVEMNAAMQALMGNSTASFKLIAKKTANGKGCAQIAQLLGDPAGTPEPLWRAGLSIAACCEEKKAVHWVSQGHPEYDPEETERKAALTKGPYTCKTFDGLNPGVCENCPLWGKITSPIQIGKTIAEAAPGEEPVKRELAAPRAAPKPGEIPPYPSPYFRGKVGGVYLKAAVGDEDETPLLVWGNDLYVVRRLTDPEFGEVVEMRHHLPRDGVRTFVVPLYVVTSKEEFRKALAMNGVAAINKEVDAIMTYTQTWVKALQHTNTADDAHRQFGWIGDFAGFVCGEEVIFSDRREYNAPSSGTRGLTEHFLPKGTLEGWKDAMAFYNRPGFELHQLVVCAGFGSVLMKFMPVNAALLHLWSKDSGFGKTTVQHAALSAWGNPSKLILGERDTYNSKMNRADVMHSLPVCMDEITNIRPADASDLIYQVTGGQQRNRMAANGNTERYRGDPWNLLFISSANCSLIDKVAMAKAMPKAEAQRVLEIEVSKLFTHKEDKELTDKFSRALHDNYGHAGPIFVQYVLQNLANVETVITTIQRQIDRAAGLGPENRFWSAAAAVSIAAAVICKHLGLLDYDVKALRDYVVEKVLKQNQRATVDLHADPMALVSEFAYQNWGRILQIKSTVDMRGRHHGNGLDQLVIPEQMPRSTDMVGRYETDMKRLFIIVKPFREWLADQQMNFVSVVDELRKKHGAKRTRIRISKGTAMNLPPTDVVEIQMLLEGPEDGTTEELDKS